MKNSFPGYYKPIDEEFAKLWDECLFVPDTNILLHMYEYSEETRQNFMQILEQLSDRLWVPHQVAFEYQQERLNVISKQISACGKVKGVLDKALKGLGGELSSYGLHPFLSTKEWLDEISTLFSRIINDIDAKKGDYPDLFSQDHLREKVDQLFDGKVGNPYSSEVLKKLYTDGKERYRLKIPPGFEDDGKQDDKKFGDLVIWKQILDHVKSAGKSVIFITDDEMVLLY